MPKRTFRRIRMSKNMCLDVEGGRQSVGAKFIAWPCHKGPNQKFRMTRRGELQAKHSKKCLNVRTFRQKKCKV